MIKVLPIFKKYNNLSANISPKKADKVRHGEIKPVITPTMTTPRSLNAQSDILIQNQITKRLFSEFLNRKGKVTLEEYKNIIKNHPSVLIEAQKYVKDLQHFQFFCTNPNVMAKVAFFAIQRLNNLYGKDNYQLVSIGTSPAFITESMAQLGVDTVFLPISNATYCKSGLCIDEMLKEYPNLNNVGKYLKTKINCDNSDKKVVLLDYSFSGKTLKTVKELTEKYCNIPPDKIEILDIAHLLYGIRANYPVSDTQKGIIFDPEMIMEEINSQDVECMSNTPHYSIYDENYNVKKPFSITTKDKTDEELFADFENFSKPSARAYQLCILHELFKNGEIK